MKIGIQPPTEGRNGAGGFETLPYRHETQNDELPFIAVLNQLLPVFQQLFDPFR